MSRGRLRRFLAWLATLTAVAVVAAACVAPPEAPEPVGPGDPDPEEPGDPEEPEEPEWPPGLVPIDINLDYLFRPIGGTLVVSETTTHVVGLTELEPGELDNQCMQLFADEQLCLGNTADPTFVVESEATTDRFLKGGDAVAALQWMADEGAQAVAALYDLPSDARVERFARPEIRSYMVTRFLDILDKKAYGKTLTADEERALAFLQQKVLTDERVLSRYAYEEYVRFTNNYCGYTPPVAPSYVTEPLAVPPAWASWCALHGATLGSVFPPPLPSVEHFQTWGMYRAASELGLAVLGEAPMQEHLGAVAQASTFLGGSLAAAGAGVLTTKLLGLSTNMAGAIASVIHPMILSKTVAATIGAASAGALVSAVLLSLVTIGIAVWQLVERESIGATLTERMNAAATATDPFGLSGLAQQNAGRDLDADRASWNGSNLPRYRRAEAVSRITEMVTRWTTVRPNGEIVPDPSDLWPSNDSTPSDIQFRVSVDGGPETAVGAIQVPAPGGGTSQVRFNRSWAIVTDPEGRVTPELTFTFVDADGETRLASRRAAANGAPQWIVVDPDGDPDEAEVVDSIRYRDAQNRLVTVRLTDPAAVTPLAVRPGVAGRLLPGVTLKLSPNPVDEDGFNHARFIDDYEYTWTVQRFDESTRQWVAQGGVTPVAFGGNPTYDATFTPSATGRHRAVVVMHHTSGAVADLTGLVEFTVVPPTITLRDVALQDDHLDDRLRLSFQVLEDGTSDQLDVRVQWPGEIGSSDPGPVTTLSGVSCAGSFPCATTQLSAQHPISSSTDLRGEVVLTVTNSHGGSVTTAIPISTPARPSFAEPPVDPEPDQAGTVTFDDYMTHLDVPVTSPSAQPNYVVAAVVPGSDPDPDPTFMLVHPTSGNLMQAIDLLGGGTLIVSVGERGGQPVIVVRSVLGIDGLGSYVFPIVVRQSNGAESTLVVHVDVVPAPGDRFRAGILSDIDPADFATDRPPALQMLLIGGRAEWGAYDGQMCVAIRDAWLTRQRCDHVSAFLNPDGSSKPFPFQDLVPEGFAPGNGVYRARVWLPDSARSWSEPMESSWIMVVGSGPPIVSDLRWEAGHLVLAVSPRSVDAPIASITCRVDGGASQPCFPVVGGTWTPPGLAPGSHEVSVLVTDAKGNYTTETLQFTS